MIAVIAVLVTIILILAAAILFILLRNHGVARPTTARLTEQKPGLVPDYVVLGASTAAAVTLAPSTLARCFPASPPTWSTLIKKIN